MAKVPPDDRRLIDQALDSQPFWSGSGCAIRGCRPADPFKRIARAERRVVLDFCLNKLGDCSLEVIWLRYYYGLTFPQIALKVGISEDLAWQAHRDALLDLKIALNGYGIQAKSHV